DVDWFRLELGSPPGGGEGAPPGNPPGGVSESPTEGGAAAEPTPPVAAAPPTMPTPFHRIALGVEAEPSANVEIQLCDGEGKPLVRTPMGHRGGWVLRNYALPPGLSSVTLSLKNMAPTLPKGQPPSPVPYSLKLSLEANNTSFEMEPNPRPSQATPLAVGGEMEALLSPPEDVDYFRVDVPQPSLLNVTLSALEGVDLQLSAIAPAEAAQETERVLLRSNEGKTQEAERLLNVHCENTCYFKVESVAQKVSGKWTKTQENSKTPYKIGVQLQGDKQRREREPNNLAEQATELPMGQNIRGYVYPKGDVDFFRVDLSTLPLRRPLLATLFGLPKNNLGLWLYRMDAEGKLELVQTAPLPKKDGPTPLRYSATPGVYFLEVKDPKNREANFQDEYQLRVEWDDAP
ncbi:MAG: ABC transporter substrate-binding protein, partial [Cystobacterineae bacterium]|nr:ABC transporter substrate-binding protein [Cystobacterineae bacterium]